MWMTSQTIERAFAERGSPTQVELAHLADPDVGILLTERGYRLESFENVLGRTIDSAPEFPPPPASRFAGAGTTSSKPG